MDAKTPVTVRVQQWVVITSIVLFVLKVAAYFLTNSVAVLTDALESTVNVVTGFTGLYSLRLAAKARRLRLLNDYEALALSLPHDDRPPSAMPVAQRE